MNRGSEIHIFWGAPIGPLKMMVSQEPTSLMSTTDPWKKVQLLYNQHSLHLKDEKCKNKNVEDYQILEAAAPPDLLNGRFLGSSLSRSVSVKDDCIHCVSETQTQKFQKSHPLGMSDITKSDVQICGCKDQVQHLTGEEEYQKLFSENKKITVEQHKHQSNVCNVTVYEDHWVDETVLQSTFTTQLLNLGNYSSVQPEEYSSMVSDVVLQDLLAYVSSKHSHLRDLRPRPPQAVSSVEFVALEQLQPGLLVHALLRVVDVTVLTEAVYSYRGQKQRKVLLTVEQAQGQHYVLVLWGRGAAWYPQLQRKKGVILVKAQILELVFHATTAQQIVINAHSSLKSIFSSLPNITYTGCAKCGLELERDENKIYKQCFSCLPCTTKKIYYRPALMTIADGLYKVCVHVGSKLMEKILLNISPDWLSRVIAPPSEVTYGLVAADLLHSLLAACGAPCVLRVQSLFVLEENSYPLQQDLSLLDFSPAWGACS
ncbi:shieldin complex subunit 2 isoform X8 [Eptesicus fuscus]|uniref:shieldin complex subunit 2 isoform X8 n=1 Tax=Eptesicus fuscus TaxID=29078 RepID=UPI0024043A33|nr:shieldin complex subunit 2 isoform X8 [Eptesicus fuscus]